MLVVSWHYDVAVFFYTKNEENWELSNFAPYGIEMDGTWWNTVEHYFQAQKFRDVAYQEQIRQADGPRAAASLGRSRDVKLRPDWEEVKDEVMRAAVLKKFQTHRELRKKLLATGDEEIVENAPGDFYWGCGADGSGQNRLGKILMAVREELRRVD